MVISLKLVMFPQNIVETQKIAALSKPGRKSKATAAPTVQQPFFYIFTYNKIKQYSRTRILRILKGPAG